MDYEKKYNEALERARKIHDEIVNNEVIGFPGQITDIFPELRESEDERIRKEIVSIVQSYRDSCISEGSHRFDDCLAWLEKQKEQKPVAWSKEDKKILDDVSHILIGLNYKQIAKDYKQAVEKLIYARPSWKPSEEQMRMLKCTIDYYDSHAPKELVSLYEQLKKFKN